MNGRITRLQLLVLLAVGWGILACNCFDPQVQPPKKKDVSAGNDSEGQETDLVTSTDSADGPGGEDQDSLLQEAGHDSGGTDASGPETQPDVAVPGCTDPEALNYDPSATEDDGSCLYPVSVTFNVDMSCAKSVAAPQVAGGNTFGMPGDYPMSDPDGDDVWTVTIPIAVGLSTAYTFTSDACQDWSCKEDIAGQECATEPYNDRFLTMGSVDMTVNACFGNCGEGFCGQCPVGSPPPESAVQCKPPQVKVEFLLDMSKAWDIAKANVIALQGSFAGFWPGIVMERIPVSKLYRVAVCLDADTDYTFKFAGYEYSNGANEFPDNGYEVGKPPCPGTTITAECQYGTCTDRLLHTGAKDSTVGVFLWGECDTYPPPL